MTSFFVNYTSNFHIEVEDQRKLIIGTKGETKKLLEEESNAKIVIENSCVNVRGAYESVKIAERKIAELLAKNYFEVDLYKTMEGHILGVSGKTIKEIQNQSRAYVRVTGMKNKRKLIIIGKPVEFRKAKELTVNIMFKKIQEQMKSDTRKEFREEIPTGGYQRRPVYVKDQLDPSPQLFFLNFNSELKDGEEIFTPQKINPSNLSPPSIVNKQSAVLAPYKGYFYRGEILAVELSEDNQDILLTVLFVDFGNVLEGVSYFACKDIDSKYLYPKIAKPCKLANISDSWKNNKVSLQKFQKYIKEEKIEKAIIISDQSSTNLNIVQITLEKGDLMAKMVNKGLAHYNHENRESNASQIGSTSLVYVMNGFSDFANVRVTTTKITKGYTCSNLFDDITPVEDAFSYAKSFFDERQSNFLEDKGLEFRLNSKVKLYGSSSGAAMALCAISIGIVKEIPSEILLTGEITADGSLLPVSNVREKAIAAFEMGKKIFYVPVLNYHEAISIWTSVMIRPIKHISEVMNDIWNN